MNLFSDRENGPKPRTIQVIDRRVESALAALIKSFLDKDAFGWKFPEKCRDGNIACGTDLQTFGVALDGAVPGMSAWIHDAVHNTAGKNQVVDLFAPQPPKSENEPLQSTLNILDTLEWLSAHYASTVLREYHGYQKHHHISWRTDTEYEFQDAVNSIFERNGIAYQFKSSGQIVRVIEGPTAKMVSEAKFNTPDPALNKLLDEAQRSFFSRTEAEKRRATEALWDAFERIKTLEVPTKKPKSIEALIAKVTSHPDGRSLIDAEMSALTAIGNQWRIRHHETDKIELDCAPEIRDYFFLRMFSLMHLLLKAY